MPDINWYPGHMAKTRRLLTEQMRAVDAVIELCDSRAPAATRNPDLDALARQKERILVLNKCDLANESVTQAWVALFRARGLTCVRFQATGGRASDIMRLIERATKPVVDKMRARGAMKTVRVMVVGIPNVGKSTFINKLRGSAITKVADRPGVTRSNQWVKVGDFLELLDTPGMLWPKLSDVEGAKTLAFLGSIKDDVTDTEELAGELLAKLVKIAPDDAIRRFKLPENAALLTAPELIERACEGRGWLLSGGRANTERAAYVILDEFRAGKVGRISLQAPGGI